MKQITVVCLGALFIPFTLLLCSCGGDEEAETTSIVIPINISSRLAPLTSQDTYSVNVVISASGMNSIQRRLNLTAPSKQSTQRLVIENIPIGATGRSFRIQIEVAKNGIVLFDGERTIDFRGGDNVTIPLESVVGRQIIGIWQLELDPEYLMSFEKGGRAGEFDGVYLSWGRYQVWGDELMLDIAGDIYMARVRIVENRMTLSDEDGITEVFERIEGIELLPELPIDGNGDIEIVVVQPAN